MGRGRAGAERKMEGKIEQDGVHEGRCRAYPGPSKLSTREENTQDTWPSREGRQRQYGMEGELVLLSDSMIHTIRAAKTQQAAGRWSVLRDK